MTDIRLQRTADGRCTLFVGKLLVFEGVTEPQALELSRALAGAVPIEQIPQQPSHAASGRDVGGRTGQAFDYAPSRLPEQALARLR